MAVVLVVLVVLEGLVVRVASCPRVRHLGFRRSEDWVQARGNWTELRRLDRHLGVPVSLVVRPVSVRRLTQQVPSVPCWHGFRGWCCQCLFGVNFGEPPSERLASPHAIRSAEVDIAPAGDEGLQLIWRGILAFLPLFRSFAAAVCVWGPFFGLWLSSVSA